MKKILLNIGAIGMISMPAITAVACSEGKETIIAKGWRLLNLESEAGQTKDEFLDFIMENKIVKGKFKPSEGTKLSKEYWFAFRKEDYEKLMKKSSKMSRYNRAPSEDLLIHNEAFKSSQQTRDPDKAYFVYSETKSKLERYFPFIMKLDGLQKISFSYTKKDGSKIEKEFENYFYENERKISLLDFDIINVDQQGQLPHAELETKVEVVAKTSDIDISLVTNSRWSSSNIKYSSNILHDGRFWGKYEPEFTILETGNRAGEKVKIVKTIEDDFNRTPQLVFTMTENDQLKWEKVEEANNYFLGRQDVGIRFWTKSGKLKSNMGVRNNDGSIYISYERLSASSPSMSGVWQNTIWGLLSHTNSEIKVLNQAKKWKAAWRPYPNSDFYLQVTGNESGDPISEDDLSVLVKAWGQRQQASIKLKTKFSVVLKKDNANLTQREFNIDIEDDGHLLAKDIEENVSIKVEDIRQLITYTKDDVIFIKSRYIVSNINDDDDVQWIDFNNLVDHYFLDEGNAEKERQKFSSYWWNNLEDARKEIKKLITKKY